MRERHRKIEAEWQKRIDDEKEQNRKDVDRIMEKHKLAENLLVNAKDAIRSSVQTSLQKERTRMEELRDADLKHKEKQHAANLVEQKKILE